jgi:hypothetical protein
LDSVSGAVSYAIGNEPDTLNCLSLGNALNVPSFASYGQVDFGPTVAFSWNDAVPTTSCGHNTFSVTN